MAEVVGIERLSWPSAFADLNRGALCAVLEAGDALTSEVLSPRNQPGDRACAICENGKATALRAFGGLQGFADSGP